MKNILRLTPGNQAPVVIKSLSGRSLIADANQVFDSYISPNFVDLKFNLPGVATPQTFLQLHDMIDNGSPLDVFNCLPGLWSQKWLSQNQVIDFCKTWPGWLTRKECSNLFLCKKDESKLIDEKRPYANLFIVRIEVFPDGLFAGVHRILEDYKAWNDEYRHRIISPKLKKI